MLSALVLTVAGAALFGSVSVYAQTPTGQSQSLVQKLAQKFGLKEADVQAVFDEDKNERHANMQARFEEQLNQAVKDGKINETQKQAIIKKMAELKAQKEASHAQEKTMTSEEHRAAYEAKRQDLESWAQQNGIDLNLLGGFGLNLA